MCAGRRGRLNPGSISTLGLTKAAFAFVGEPFLSIVCILGLSGRRFCPLFNTNDDE